MNSSALAYLNSLDSSYYKKLGSVSSDPDNTSLANTVALKETMLEEQHQLAMVVQAVVAAKENRQIAQGQFVDHLV